MTGLEIEEAQGRIGRGAMGMFPFGSFARCLLQCTVSLELRLLEFRRCCHRPSSAPRGDAATPNLTKHEKELGLHFTARGGEKVGAGVGGERRKEACFRRSHLTLMSAA